MEVEKSFLGTEGILKSLTDTFLNALTGKSCSSISYVTSSSQYPDFLAQSLSQMPKVTISSKQKGSLRNGHYSSRQCLPLIIF